MRETISFFFFTIAHGNSFYIQANIYPVKDGLICTDRELEVIENVELIEDLTS